MQEKLEKLYVFNWFSKIVHKCFFFRFDLIRLVENEGDVEVIRETYERAIANVPPSKEKRYWRR